MYTLRVLQRVKDVPREEWDALVGDDHSPFLEWTWLDALEEAGCVGGATGWTSQHFTVWHKDEADAAAKEKLVAVAPAYVKTNSEGEFVYDWSWADLAERLGVPYYPKLVFGVPFTPVTGERVAVRAGEARAPIVAAIADAVRQIAGDVGLAGAHVLFPPEDERKEWENAGFFARAGIQYHWHNRGYATYDDFLGTFRSKRRNQLKREASQPAKDGVTIETLDPRTIDTAMTTTMYEFYASTVDKFFYGRRYLTPKFFSLVVERFRERLAWVVARRDGEPIAGAFNVKKGKRLYGRYWGTRADLPFLHFNVCYYHGVRQCIAEGLEAFEPGAGGEHKLVRGFDPTMTHSAHILGNAASPESFARTSSASGLRFPKRLRRTTPIADEAPRQRIDGRGFRTNFSKQTRGFRI